jgi:hypothetical protein
MGDGKSVIIPVDPAVRRASELVAAANRSHNDRPKI